ncbi:MAG: ABC transporter substrate-binding protein [Paracoccaceae bacterium]
MMATILQANARLVDPHDCTDAADDLTILQAICDPLVRRKGTEHLPALARSWSTTDGQDWMFKLRPDVAFHDGTRVDAEAVRQSLQRMARPDKGYTLGAPGVWHQYLGAAKIDVEAPLVIRVRLAHPMADLLDVLEQAFIVAPSVIEALDAGNLHRLMGSGPYKLSAQGPGCITAEAATRPQHPPNPQIEWRACPDEEIRQSLLETGEAQVATRIASIAKAPVTTIHHRGPVAIIYLLNAAHGPLSDPRLRRALHLGLDRTSLIDDVLDGAAEPLFGFVSPGHFGADPDAIDPYDPSAAKALLAEAAHADGLVLNVDCPTRLPDEAERLTACLADQLGSLGITLNVTLHPDREAYAHMIRRKEIGDLCVFDSSPLSTFRVLYEKIDSRIAGSWWQGYRNPKVETLLDTARITVDQKARASIYRQIYRLLQDDPPWLTLYNPIRTYGFAGQHLHIVMPVDGVLDVAGLPTFGS